MTPPQTAASSRDPWMNSTVGAPSILVALQAQATLPSPVLPPTITTFCRRTCSSGPSLLSSQPVPTSLWQSGTRVQDLFGTSRYRNGMDRGSRRRDTALRPTWRGLALIESTLGG